MRFWGRYVPVAERRAKAAREMNKLRKKGKSIQPVEIEGRSIARSFWGKGWCTHLESFSDFANRLPRGRTYVRNGSVCHLDILPGRIEAIVSGSSLYHVTINIRKLQPAAWTAIKEKCASRIGSLLELLKGQLSDQVMAIVTDPKGGLFPKPGEIEFSCSCPDWAVMCKHVASVLYGVGSRLDSEPELLFLLRDVDAQELIAADFALNAGKAETAADSIAEEQLSDIFGIDLDLDAPPKSPGKAKSPSKAKRHSKAKSAKKAVRLTKPDRAKKPKNTHKPQPDPKPAAATGPGKKARPAAALSCTVQPTGKSVARLRKKLKLSVAQFAAELGVTPASIYRWEATPGRLNLHRGSLAALEKSRGRR